MKLLSLTVENFMPYKGRSTITFPTEESRNVMMVFGENMRGKTSLLNALRWGFYGRALGRHLREIPLHELHNKEAAREGDWIMEVRIEFQAGGHHYEVLRRAQKRASVVTPSRSEDFAIDVALQRDSVAVSGHLIDSEINRYAPEKVSRFFLFDGELLQEYEELLIEGSEQGKKIKRAIEQVLGVPTLINGRDDLGTILKAAQRQQARDLAHVKGLESQAQKQESIQSRRDALESDLRVLQDRLQEIAKRREGLDDELSKVDAVHRASIELNVKRTQQKEITAALDGLRRERLDLVKDAWRDVLKPKLEARRAVLVERQGSLQSQAEHQSRNSVQVQILKRLLSTSTCPTCDHEIDERDRQRLGKTLGELEVSVDKAQELFSELGSIASEIRALDDLIARTVGARVRAIDKQILKGEVDLTRVENEAETLQSEIRGYDTAEIARKRAHRDSLVREEGQVGRDIENVIREIENTRKELAIIARQLENMPSARARRSTALVSVATQLEAVFAESIERLRDRLRQDVEARASEAFRNLTTQKTYSGLRINRNYGLSILDAQGEPVTVRSAGAEQIVALSLIDGLAKTGRAAGPVVMDTPFGRLDLQHRDNILRYLPTTTSQLVLLVHGGEVRRPRDLEPVASRIGASYEIHEVSARHSQIVRSEQ